MYGFFRVYTRAVETAHRDMKQWVRCKRRRTWGHGENVRHIRTRNRVGFRRTVGCWKGVLRCEKKHMAYRKKYKPCILKYKALISKYMPYVFFITALFLTMFGMVFVTLHIRLIIKYLL